MGQPWDISPLTRFSDRVQYYVKYRPYYPKEMLKFFQDQLQLNPNELIADIGSGTGFSSILFVENGNKIIGVEPNDEMRVASLDFFSNTILFSAIKGTAESTNLKSNSIDLIISGQAFHWFDAVKTKIEFTRILNNERSKKAIPNVAIFWNTRIKDIDPFAIAYEQLLSELNTDYRKIKHESVENQKLNELFGEDNYQKVEFKNLQNFDLDGLLGRSLSSSFTPSQNDPNFEKFKSDLIALFHKYEKNGIVKFTYNVEVYTGLIS